MTDALEPPERGPAPPVVPPGDAVAAPAPPGAGRFVLGLFGLTGVGKSTLVNAVFGAELADVGIGAPVTQDATLYHREGHWLGVYDTRGLELGTGGGRILRQLRSFVDTNRLGAVDDQIHVIWYCLRAGDRRIQPAEEDFLRALADLGIPVLLVITQTPLTPGGDIHPDARALADSLAEMDLPIRGVHFVNAVADAFAGVPSHGLDDLLADTARLAPEGVRSALAAAQQVSARQKRTQALRWVDWAQYAVSGRVLLRHIDATWGHMVASIAQIYDMDPQAARRVLAADPSVRRLQRGLQWSRAGLAITPATLLPAAIVSRLTARGWPGSDGTDEADDDAAGPGSGDDEAITRVRTGLGAGGVTRAIGEAWIDTCEEYWHRAYPDSPSGVDEAELARTFAGHIHRRLPSWLRASGGS